MRWSAAIPAKAPSWRSALPSTDWFPRADALRKGGLGRETRCILTKPIGTGTLLAADMRGKAKARWVMAAIAHMIHSNGRAADILRRHGVHAATDVTGFGLIGHLVEMVRASDVDVTLAVDRVPLLDGARETVALGIFSSLQPQNVRLRRAIRDLETSPRKHPLYPLLFDPQTAGGLLAAVPLGEAERCVAALRAAGYAGADVMGLRDRAQRRARAGHPRSDRTSGSPGRSRKPRASRRTIRSADLRSHWAKRPEGRNHRNRLVRASSISSVPRPLMIALAA